MTTYAVIATPDEEWWSLSVPELPGVYSQVRTLNEAEEMIRDAIALYLDAPEDSFDVTLDLYLDG